jgi:hypothetical protein
MNRCRILALAMAAGMTAMALAAAACGGGGQGVFLPGRTQIQGTYVNEDDSSEYLELKEGGDFFVKEEGIGFSGEWEIEDSTITFHMGETGLAARATLDNGRILDEDGKVWVKGERGSEAASLDDLAAAACEDMSTVSGSDDWEAYNRAEERAQGAGHSTSDLDDALRKSCPDVFSEYVDNQ